MVRRWPTAVFCVLLVGSVVGEAPTFPEHDEEIFRFHFEDGQGDEHDRCLLLNNGVRPTPCDILAFSMGNTSTHLVVRWNMTTLEFGESGRVGFVEFDTSLQGSHEDLFTGRERVVFRLLPDGGLEIDPYGNMRATWIEQMKWSIDKDAGQVSYAVPLDRIGDLMDDETDTDTWGLSVVGHPRTRVNPIGQLEEDILAGHSQLNTVADSVEIPPEDRRFDFHE